MSATSIGSGNFAMSAETGFIVQSLQQSYSAEEARVKDHTGSTIGLTKYDETCKVSLEAWVADTNPFAGKIGGTLTLTNGLSAHLQQSVTAGEIVIDSITKKFEIEGYKSISVEATYYPLL
jgi:hypothetical protein